MKQDLNEFAVGNNKDNYRIIRRNKIQEFTAKEEKKRSKNFHDLWLNDVQIII